MCPLGIVDETPACNGSYRKRVNAKSVQSNKRENWQVLLRPDMAHVTVWVLVTNSLHSTIEIQLPIIVFKHVSYNACKLGLELFWYSIKIFPH